MSPVKTATTNSRCGLACSYNYRLKGPIFLLLTICLFVLPAQAKYGGGTGEPNDPYLIYDANQMNAIGADPNDWDKHFKLVADINLGCYVRDEFNIIGTDYDNPFTGVFDGNGHSICKFTYEYEFKVPDSLGLFAYVRGDNSQIKDLRLIDPNVNSGTAWCIGSLAGYLGPGTIVGCCVEGGSISGSLGVGGLVGVNHGTITNCYSRCDVYGVEGCGGLVASNGQGTIINCYSSSSVSDGQVLGGLVARNEGTITNCYSNGAVSGFAAIGGLVVANTGSVEDCFWDVQTSGQSWSGGGTGKTTAEMQMQSTFTNWDFDNVWKICEGEDYPRLLREKYGGGTGESDRPYLIYTSCQMNAMGANPNDWGKHFKLRADIDLGGYVGEQFNIIGISENQPFSGSFDGNGHTISNFSYISEHRAYLGLFGCINGPNAQIKDLRLIDPNVDTRTGSTVGSLVGCLEHGTIIGCCADGGSISGEYDVGGLVGDNGGSITGCNSSVSVSGFSPVGGLVGVNNGIISHCDSNGAVLRGGPVGGIVGVNVDGTITNCSSSGSVSGDQGIAGLVGGHFRGTITNCYSSASVSGAVVVGGLVGFNGSRITNCYAVGATYGSGMVGGLVASNWTGLGTAEDCFWDVNTTGQTSSDGGAGKTTAEMQMKSTFTGAGWDFANVWDICEGTNYPRLLWQIPLGDMICPDGVNLLDYSFFAGHWMDSNCAGSNDCDGTDFDASGIVDMGDLRVFAENWLAGVE